MGMKPLHKYLNHVSKWHGSNTFPIINDKDLIIKFLEKEGFKKYKDPIFGLDKMFYEVKNSATRIYFLGSCDPGTESSYWIRFANPGKVTEENPMFFCRLRNVNKSNTLKGWRNYSKEIESVYDDKFTNFDTYQEFVDEVNRFFKWS